MVFLFRAGPTFIHRGGAPPPPLLLGACAPRNGSRLSRADAPGPWPSRVFRTERRRFKIWWLERMLPGLDDRIGDPTAQHDRVDSAVNREALDARAVGGFATARRPAGPDLRHADG